MVLMYDIVSSLYSVNEARKVLFTCKSRAIDNISPTSAALFQHINRVAYQAGFCWGQALVVSPDIPSPFNWGWKKDH